MTEQDKLLINLTNTMINENLNLALEEAGADKTKWAHQSSFILACEPGKDNSVIVYDDGEVVLEQNYSNHFHQFGFDIFDSLKEAVQFAEDLRLVLVKHGL